MDRLFHIELGEPARTARGSIDLFYGQESVREPLDIMPDGEMLEEVTAKLDLLAELFTNARPEEES